MNKTFVRTNNVKNFIGLVENLVNKPKNIPKMGLVYGEPGLSKTQTALWLACKYDGIYLSEILKFETFGVSDIAQIVNELSQVLIPADAIEYIHQKHNRFRQIVQLINKLETLAKENNLTEITLEIVRQVL